MHVDDGSLQAPIAFQHGEYSTLYLGSSFANQTATDEFNF
jgi:hypothetical protein